MEDETFPCHGDFHIIWLKLESCHLMLVPPDFSYHICWITTSNLRFKWGFPPAHPICSACLFFPCSHDLVIVVMAQETHWCWGEKEDGIDWGDLADSLGCVEFERAAGLKLREEPFMNEILVRARELGSSGHFQDNSSLLLVPPKEILQTDVPESQICKVTSLTWARSWLP